MTAYFVSIVSVPNDHCRSNHGCPEISLLSQRNQFIRSSENMTQLTELEGNVTNIEAHHLGTLENPHSKQSQFLHNLLLTAVMNHFKTSLWVGQVKEFSNYCHC